MKILDAFATTTLGWILSGVALYALVYHNESKVMLLLVFLGVLGGTIKWFIEELE